MLFYSAQVHSTFRRRQKAAEKLFFVAEKLLVSDAEFLFGSWSIVDAELALMLQRLIQNGDAVPQLLKPMHYSNGNVRPYKMACLAT